MSFPSTPSTPHPSPAMLVAYHSDELSGSEQDTVREHIAFCPECLGRLRAMRQLEEDLEKGVPAAPSPSEGDPWEQFQETLRDRGESLPEAPPTVGRLENRQPSPYLALAALFLLGFGLAFLLTGLRSGPEGYGNPVSAALLSEDSPGQRSGGDVTVIDAASSGLTLSLGTLDPLPSGTYRMTTLAAPEDAPHPSLEELRPDAHGQLRVVLMRHGLASGEYRFAIYSEGKEEPVATFRILLEIQD